MSGLGRAVIALGIVLAAIWGATAWSAWRLGFPPALGSPWFALLRVPVYGPVDIFWWWPAAALHARPVFVEGAAIIAAGAVGALAVAAPMRRARGAKTARSNKDKDMRILISGASVSGLSAAYWLSRYGFKVTVVERATHLRPGGQALDVRGAAAVEVAERMGILATIRERSTKLTGMSMVDPTGRETFRSEERTLTGGRFDSPDVEILRDHLVQVLYDAVGDRVDFLFDDSIASLSQDASGVDVVLADAGKRRFDLVIGADGVRSGVRRLAFGPDERFIRYLGSYIAVFSVPNFLSLDHWQVFCQDDDIGGGLLVMAKDEPARTYLGFNTPEPLDYDYRDIAAQKQLLVDRIAGRGWVFPQLLAYMQDTPDFYFDSINQIRMDRWSDGRIVLLGDAGYAVSLSTGQGTSVALVAAYVLAGELATHRADPLAAIRIYERDLRDYVLRNQELADSDSLPDQPSSDDPAGGDAMIDPDSVPDFNKRAIAFDLKTYKAAAE